MDSVFEWSSTKCESSYTNSHGPCTLAGECTQTQSSCLSEAWLKCSCHSLSPSNLIYWVLAGCLYSLWTHAAQWNHCVKSKWAIFKPKPVPPICFCFDHDRQYSCQSDHPDSCFYKIFSPVWIFQHIFPPYLSNRSLVSGWLEFLNRTWANSSQIMIYYDFYVVINIVKWLWFGFGYSSLWVDYGLIPGCGFK